MNDSSSMIRFSLPADRSGLVFSSDDALAAGARAAGLRKEGLAELVYYHQKTANPQGRLTQSLKKDYLSTVARNMVFAGSLENLRLLLDGLPVALLKGAYLTTCVYPDPGLRRYGDFDLLIREEDKSEADRRLIQEGYGRMPGSLDDRGSFTSVPYRPASPGPPVHVHWSLFNSSLPKYMSLKTDVRCFLDKARPSPVGYLALCPEHQMIHLCDHAMRHSYDRLILLRDLCEVMEKNKTCIDMDLLAHEAVRVGVAGPVYYAFLVLGKYGLSLCEQQVLDKLRPLNPGWAGRLFERFLLEDRRKPELSSLYYSSIQQGLGKKARFFYRMMIPDRATMSVIQGKNIEQVQFRDFFNRWLRGVKHAQKWLNP
ncbi:MAG: nucleotidyltransferase family protein [Lentisphaerota bacterium]